MVVTKHKTSKLRLVLVTIAAFLTAVSQLCAQSYQGGIRGAVKDQQGAVIANVKITLVNESTNTARSTITNADGSYVFSAVDPATYVVTAESPNFKKFERKGVIVGTQEFLTVDLDMEVGQVTQSVMVTEEVPLVEASNASQGQVIDRQKLVDLPNLGRNPFMMAKVAQNVVAVGNPAYNRMQDQSGSSQISIAGGPVRGNNYLLDGIPITDANNRAIIIPSIEAVQEVKVQANTYDAEMARTGGGMFNALLKSGSNGYHGVVFGSTRQTGWAANNFFNNAAGIPLPKQENYTYGASFSGKVWIPKVYDGKDKTFFSLAWEGYNDTQANSQQFYTPTALERQGNFSQTRSKSGGLNVIYDTLSNGSGGYTRVPFSGNIIPASRLNAVGVNIANTYVQPTKAAAYFGDPNVTGAGVLPSRAAQYVGKIDHQVTEWWHVNLSYLRYFSLEPGNTFFPTISSPDQWRLQRRVDATQANSLFTINPTTVLTVRYGFNRFPNHGYQVSQGFNLASLGFPASYVSQVPSPTFPNVGMTTSYSLGTNNNFYYVHASKNASVNISKFAGRHSLKGGFDYRRIYAVGNDFSDSAGNFKFNGIYTRSTNLASGSGGADIADLLLGSPNSATGYVPTKLGNFADYYGGYIQDDFRLSSKITLNFGLRYEREYGLEEQKNRLVVGFNTQALNTLAAGVTGTGQLPKGVVQFAGQNGNKEYVGNYNLNKLGPRLGMAYQLDSKTTFRGGYGLYWAPQFALGAPLQTPGFTATTQPNASLNNNLTPAISLSNPFPGGLAQPAGFSQGDLTGVGQTLNIVDSTARSTRVHQFSFDVQRELPFGIALEVGYVGSRTGHLTLGTANVNINSLNPTLFSQGSSLTSSVSNPYYGKGGTGVIGGQTVPAYQLLLPYPTFGTINYQFSDKNKARYDSMVVKAQKRLSKGLTFLSTFTWSRTFDGSSSGPGNFLNSQATSQGPQNPYNMSAEYSLSNIDSPLRWTNTFTYELPFGKGKPFLTNSKLWDAIAGGWSVNAISIYQTGFPLQIYQDTNNNSQFGYGSQRPNATGVSPSTSGSLESRLSSYINPAAFSSAPQFTFGNLSRSLNMRGPGMANWDSSLFKTFSVGEKFKGQFRTALLNTFNTPLFAAPNTAFGNSNFGKITSQANFSRMLELGVRLYF